jgi:hypothetical protein
VWKFVYRSPSAASRSNVGVSIVDPKHAGSANPRSSRRTTTTLGRVVGSVRVDDAVTEILRVAGRPSRPLRV